MILQAQVMRELLAIDSEFELKEKLLELLERAEELGVKDEFAFKYKEAIDKPKKNKRKLKKASVLMEKELEEPTVFVGVGEEVPLLVEGTCILSAKPKLGKSWLVLAMCLAISEGEDFLGYKTKKCSTLYLDLETSEQLQQKRIRKILNGRVVPSNFYIDTETDSLDDGFCDQIEDYIQQDPEIGVVVIDVFQIIRSSAKNRQENEYQHAYRDITPLNELAKKYNLSIILVCHDRKMVDTDDPFANILGSTGLQGAVAQMMVMFKPRRDLPIHLSVKGKTIDGIIDLDVALDKGKWTVTSAVESEAKQLEDEYFNNEIRRAVLALVENGGYKGRCTGIIEESAKIGIGITVTVKELGGFLTKHIGRFLKEDNVLIEIIKNGTGPNIYKISKSTIDTIDDFVPVIGPSPWE